MLKWKKQCLISFPVVKKRIEYLNESNVWLGMRLSFNFVNV